MDRRIRTVCIPIAVACLILSAGLAGRAQDANTPPSLPQVCQVTIDTSKVSQPISPYIYGQFIEHLGRCIYGGIWAEMLEDRKFYYAVPAKGDIWRFTEAKAKVLTDSPWKLIGPAGCIQMVQKDAFSGNHSPQITVDGKEVGIYQEELGLVKGKSYVGYAWLAASRGVGPVKISLSWGPGQDQIVVQKIRRVPGKYTRFSFKFTAGDNTENGQLSITALGKGWLRIGCVSLMPADNVEGFRKDTLELLKQLNAPLYRWPGGNFVSGYDWRDGIGDRDRRPTRTNPAWTGIETNDMGMHEFVRLCELIGAEPMITVNTGFGDAYSAAAQVEYCNGSTDTPMGKLRAKNGHPKPFNVKWWCVGNEMWGRWQLGYMQLSHYVLKHNWVVDKMRQVDPTIKTIASGDLGDGGPRSWSRGMLASCADHMELIAEHFYCQERPDIVEHIQQIPNNIRRKAEGHRRLRQELDSLKDKDIRIAMTEWNFWYGPHVFGELGTRYFLKDALGIAAGLHEYFRNTDIIFMANYAQTVNVIGCIKTTKTAADFDSTGLPLKLYRQQYGRIPVAVEHDGQPLDIAAALTEDKKALTIGVVNPLASSTRLQLSLGQVSPAGPAQAWVITADDPMAYNQPGEPRRVDIRPLPSCDPTSPLSIQPLSITLFRIPLR
ncbi:MAG: alpha-L-arabinofuranosidase C-terminal domain-containing protein [Sedimentisphaerales bacterium]|nr:alpha-L-arabinofuranosidase C-terminal domain-containing protein [Sedimentisphaerales bacterium]